MREGRFYTLRAAEMTGGDGGDGWGEAVMVDRRKRRTRVGAGWIVKRIL